MNKFINREAELQSLHDDYAKTGSSLYILYGRRRLGKTTLLRQFAARRPAVYHMADRSAESDARHREHNLKLHGRARRQLLLRINASLEVNKIYPRH